MFNTINIEFLKSALKTKDCLHSLEEIVEWLKIKNQETYVEITEIPFSQMSDWGFDSQTGALRHKTGNFFSIEGIQVKTNWGNVAEWQQPIINQPEIGYLGIITKQINGVLYFLLQAKIEPGNVNHVQLSPTLQATRSNYEARHQGKKPIYLEYFQGVNQHQILLDQLQSEQGARFLRKRNRNIIIKIEEEIELQTNFIWVTLGQIKELLKFDNLVNMDTRTVISGISFTDINPDVFETICETNNLTYDSKKHLVSYLNNSFSLYTFDEILNWITRLKFYYDLEISSVDLRKVMHWKIEENEIKHHDNLYFKVIATEVKINNREVATWNQPLVQPVLDGIIAFIIRKIEGVYHFLIQAKVEPGNFDVVEMAPTVQCITGSYKHSDEIPFLKEILNATSDQIIFDTLQSEEGGRFYHEQNRNLIIEVDDLFSLVVPENYKWISLSQLTLFLKFNNYLNIQSRSLISALNLNL